MLVFLGRLWQLVRPYRVRLFMGVAAGIISGLISPLLILTIMFVYGAVFPTADSATSVQLPIRRMPGFMQDWFESARGALQTSNLHEHPWALAALIGAIPFIMLLRGVFGYLDVYCLQWVSSRAVTDLRTRLFAHLLNLSTGFYTENPTGKLLARLMNDTGALQMILSNATSVIVRDPITLLSLLAMLLWQQPKLTIITLVALPLCIIPIIIFGRKVRLSSRATQTQSADLTQIIMEAFTGHRVVKAYSLENIVAEQFRNTARKSIGHYMRMVRANEIPGPLIEFFGACGVGLLLAYLIFFSPGSHPDPTKFMQLILSVFMMYAPMKNLTRLQNQIIQARAASERAFALLATKNAVPEPAQPRPLQSGAEIQFDHVSFAYGDKVVLHDINLQIKSGQLIALVGASGAGKTTLSNLLLRFYDPLSGAIRIGGVDIREAAARDLRNQIAVVAQENILFNETIRRNIELGRIGATDAEIIAAAKHAHAHEFITENPEGYNAVIGEKGVKLSGGQRQRIAIARAVLKNAPILILDEATNALDTESERAVQSALDGLMKGRTTLCIAHRFSTILHADLIVVMEQGRIIETGRHDGLIERGGVYKKLYAMQFQS